MSGWSTLQRAALCTVELSCLRKVPFPPASSVMWPSPRKPASKAPAGDVKADTHSPPPASLPSRRSRALPSGLVPWSAALCLASVSRAALKWPDVGAGGVVDGVTCPSGLGAAPVVVVGAPADLEARRVEDCRAGRMERGPRRWGREEGDMVARRRGEPAPGVGAGRRGPAIQERDEAVGARVEQELGAEADAERVRPHGAPAAQVEHAQEGGAGEGLARGIEGGRGDHEEAPMARVHGERVHGVADLQRPPRMSRGGVAQGDGVAGPVHGGQDLGLVIGDQGVQAGRCHGYGTDEAAGVQRQLELPAAYCLMEECNPALHHGRSYFQGDVASRIM